MNGLFTPEVVHELDTAREAGIMLSNVKDSRLAALSNEARVALGLLHQYASLRHFLEEPDIESRYAEMSQKLDISWFAVCLSFIQPFRHDAIMGPLIKYVLSITSKGAVVDEQKFTNSKQMTLDEASAVGSVWFSGLLAISFCHCKNVAVKRSDVPRRLAKRNAERGHPSLSFNLLEITPMKKTLDRVATENHTGIKKALHICRGHFAEYQDRGLFGKYKGRFWIPQHVKGSIQTGVAVKDYSVNAPGGKE